MVPALHPLMREGQAASGSQGPLPVKGAGLFRSLYPDRTGAGYLTLRGTHCALRRREADLDAVGIWNLDRAEREE